MFKYKRGNADVAFFVGFFAVLFLLWWAGGGGQKGASGKPKSLLSVSKTSNPSISSSRSSGNASKESGSAETSSNTSRESSSAQIKYNTEGEPLSPWQGQVTISSLGTAKGVYDPDFEYIVLRAAKGNKEPVNITGWSLLNGRNRNAAAFDISQQKGVANQAYLPEGRSVYLISGLDFLQPIRLSAGQEAVVVTGRTPRVGSYGSSFRTNICLGYLEDSDEKFYPSLPGRCPDPEIEPGIEFVDDECHEFIARLASCHTPEFRSYTESDGRRRQTPSVDNTAGLSSSCRDYLHEHYSYGGCVNNHLNDKNFYGSQWRVYLNRPWEMWAKGDEVITLFDDRGLVVDRKSY